MTDQLVALLGGRAVGYVRRDRRGRLSFIYNDDWRYARGAYPLSVSMPLAAAEHGHAAVEAFLWGLLPDNEFVLDRWARKFHVSARNAFALISHVGEDCAGAAQFVRSERVKAYVGTDLGAVEWLDEQGVAPNGYVCSEQTTQLGERHGTQASSVWLVPSRRQPCCSKMDDGMCLLGAYPRRIS